MAGKQFRLFALTFVIGSAAFETGKSSARAQFGFGMGFEIFRPVPSPSQFINDHALTRAAAGRREPARNVYSNNPNSYMNRIRDNGFSSHSGTQSHRSPGFEVDRGAAARNLSQSRNNIPPPPPLSTPEADPRPLYPINSFFNAARKLVWPSEAPETEELKPKRDISDQACLVVLEMVEQHRSAPITTVTDARQRLLDYGKPALRVVRSLSTPRIAEAFHLFMLSLYDSLAAAANPSEGS